MVKFACAAWGFREKSWQEYCRIAASMGLTNLEIQLGRRPPQHISAQATDDEIEETKRIAREAGVKIVALAGSSNFTSADPVELETQIQSAQKQIALAAELGAQVIRLFTGGLAWDYVPPEVYTRVQYALNRIGDYAESRGVKVGIENHGGPTRDGLRIARIMEGVESPAVGINYDPANFLKIGVDPLIALRQIRPWVNYTHWKDVRWVEGETAYCAVGEGEIQWRPIVRELLEVEYTGYWAIEYETPEDVERGTRESFTYLKKVVEEIR